MIVNRLSRYTVVVLVFLSFCSPTYCGGSLHPVTSFCVVPFAILPSLVILDFEVRSFGCAFSKRRPVGRLNRQRFHPVYMAMGDRHQAFNFNQRKRGSTCCRGHLYRFQGGYLVICSPSFCWLVQRSMVETCLRRASA